MWCLVDLLLLLLLLLSPGPTLKLQSTLSVPAAVVSAALAGFSGILQLLMLPVAKNVVGDESWRVLCRGPTWYKVISSKITAVHVNMR